MTAAKPFPCVEAVRMEPGGGEWGVVVDNAKAPAYSARLYASGLTEAEARHIAAAINHFGPLREALRERIGFACREACPDPSTDTPGPDNHTPLCDDAHRVRQAALLDAADAGCAG